MTDHEAATEMGRNQSGPRIELAERSRKPIARMPEYLPASAKRDHSLT